MLIGFEQFLLQATVVDSVSALIVAVTGLVAAGSGIAIAIINKRAQGRQLTEQEKKIIKAAEFAQLGAQKGKENIGEINAFMKAVYDSLSPEQKIEANRKLKPLLDASAERVMTTENQIELFAKILGIDVNQNAEVPRESAATLDQINEAVIKAKLKDVLGSAT